MAACTTTTDAGRAKRKADVALAGLRKAVADRADPNRLFEFEERARVAAEVLPDAVRAEVLGGIRAAVPVEREHAEPVPTDRSADPLFTDADRAVLAVRRAQRERSGGRTW